MRKNNGGPAFPEPCDSESEGMSLRDWFAGQALGPLIACMMNRRNEPGYSDDGAVVEAVRLSMFAADFMIAEREK